MLFESSRVLLNGVSADNLQQLPLAPLYWQNSVVNVSRPDTKFAVKRLSANSPPMVAAPCDDTALTDICCICPSTGHKIRPLPCFSCCYCYCSYYYRYCCCCCCCVCLRSCSYIPCCSPLVCTLLLLLLLPVQLLLSLKLLLLLLFCGCRCCCSFEQQTVAKGRPHGNQSLPSAPFARLLHSVTSNNLERSNQRSLHTESTSATGDFRSK